MKSVKMFAAMFFAAIVLTLTGCSKDPEDLIIGTWNATKVIATYTYDGNTETETETFKEGEAQMTFKDNGTVVIKSTDNGVASEETGSYDVDDNKITLTSEGQSMTGDIVSIDKKEMEIKFNMSMQGVSMTADMFFKKA